MSSDEAARTRTALVVDASDDLGDAIADSLQGWTVETLRPPPRESATRGHDLIAEVVRERARELDALDALICLLPEQRRQSFDQTGLQDWRDALDRQFGVFVSSCAGALELMRPGGRIILVCSASGVEGAELSTPDAAAAGAAVGFLKCLAVELAARGILVNAVMRDKSNNRAVSASVRFLAEDAGYFCAQLLHAGASARGRG
jgi:NAD(P)-dependent dehydrogenase (short-subunit alcohol dehydrogenase family)